MDGKLHLDIQGIRHKEPFVGTTSQLHTLELFLSELTLVLESVLTQKKGPSKR